MTSYTILINRNHPLPKDFLPDFLTEPVIPFSAPPNDQKRLLQKEAALAVTLLFDQAASEGIGLIGISGYRSYSRQKELYENAIQRGCAAVAPPGASEHQSGLALDVSCSAIGLELENTFADTREGKWLTKHAPLYGFILRYPKDKEHITGYPWEPWHIRYVGKSLSLYCSLTNLTLEEYYSQLKH